MLAKTSTCMFMMAHRAIKTSAGCCHIYIAATVLADSLYNANGSISSHYAIMCYSTQPMKGMSSFETTIVCLMPFLLKSLLS